MKRPILTLVACTFWLIVVGSTCGPTTKAPSVPDICGPVSGIVDAPLSFRVVSTDEAGDTVAYMVDWGDTSQPEWTPFAQSGESVSVAHTYGDSGDYLIKSKAKNGRALESSWSAEQTIQIAGRGALYPDSILGEIPITGRSFSGAITPDDQYLYVLMSNTSSVLPLRLADRTALPAIDVGQAIGDLDRISIDPRCERAYVTMQSARCVKVIRLSDGIVVDSIALQENMGDLGVTQDGTHLCVTSSSTQMTYVVRTSDCSLVDSLNTGDFPSRLAFDPSGQYVVISHPHKVAVLRQSDWSLVSEVPSDCTTGEIAVAEDGTALYVAFPQDSAVGMVSTDNWSLGGRAYIGNNGLGTLVAGAHGQLLLVLDHQGIRYVDCRTNTVAGTLLYPRYPGEGHGLVSNHVGRELYLLGDFRIYVIGVRSQ